MSFETKQLYAHCARLRHSLIRKIIIILKHQVITQNYEQIKAATVTGESIKCNNS